MVVETVLEQQVCSADIFVFDVLGDPLQYFGAVPLLHSGFFRGGHRSSEQGA